MKIILPALVAVVGIVVGWLIWAGSPTFTGYVEPWDPPDSRLYYHVSLFLGGALASLIAPRWYGWSAIGVFLGQGAFMTAYMPPSPFGPLGLFGAAFFSVVSLMGGWCVYRVLRTAREWGVRTRDPGDRRAGA